MKARFFSSQDDFRSWLEQYHETESELVVGYYKVGTKKPSMTWSESVDQALCFGWIDGVRRSIDDESYSIRFTPRKKNSIWSAINIAKMEKLTQLGRVAPAGLKAYSYKTEQNSYNYSFERALAQLTTAQITLFKSNEQAWEFFNKQAPSYQKVILHWITSAKQEKTQLARLEKLLQASEKGERLR
jgi:uncharacterized protein YdeI (YjbR/CyaY-like superfamily)